MIIESIEIRKFRGFEDVRFGLADNLTAIAGQNGTQKSTLLGIITQPFTINDKEHPMLGENPLCGGSFKSQFQDKFRLSPVFDNAKEHEWTLNFHEDRESYTVESINRDKQKGSIRFWKKGDKEAGSGYVQLPTIFLSLKRVLPIGEERAIKASDDTKLSQEEQKIFEKEYKKILLLHDESIKSVDYLESSNKQTAGVSTASYDWNSNSSGQDNVSKLILAVLSFKRLKEKYPDDYEGGILAVDEIDATLYPASQIYLLKFLQKYSSKLKLQVVFTTHSLTILEYIQSILENKNRESQARIVFLKKQNQRVTIAENPAYERIRNNLKVELSGDNRKKIPVFLEDREAKDFARSLLGNSFSIELIPIKLSCSNLIDLGRRGVPSFTFPNAIVVLDGDSKKDLKKKRLTNFLCLPTEKSPERVIATVLDQLDDEDPFWEKHKDGYSKQFCFKEHKFEDIMDDRDVAKAWYDEQIRAGVWGRGGATVFNLVKANHPEESQEFKESFSSVYHRCL